ncbi:uncharacterized protein N7518_009271, partial [Penicillium psychrosexuale]|uniref:uncharacterized protein n=1 Tax=Penicillium psychrosexuale TaxID=1002107 RepID=UPI002545ABD2
MVITTYYLHHILLRVRSSLTVLVPSISTPPTLHAFSTYIKQKQKTYNSEDSLVVTHPTTNSPACGLSTAERTGSPIFHTLWSYVFDTALEGNIEQLRIINYSCGRMDGNTAYALSLPLGQTFTTKPKTNTYDIAIFHSHSDKTKTKTYNSEDSLVVTHPTTNSPACGLCAVSSSVGVAWGEKWVSAALRSRDQGEI